MLGNGLGTVFCVLLYFYQFFLGFQRNLRKQKQFNRCRREDFLFIPVSQQKSQLGTGYLLFLKGAGIDRLFEMRVEGRLIRSVIINWSVGHFLNSVLKGHFHEKSIEPFHAV